MTAGLNPAPRSTLSTRAPRLLVRGVTLSESTNATGASIPGERTASLSAGPGSGSGEEGRQAGGDGLGRFGLPGRGGDQGGVDRVAHVGAFDEDLGHRRQVGAGQVVARLDAVGAVIGA